MQIITTREFRANQKKYFELAEKETIFVSRRNAAPIVVYAATEEDFSYKYSSSHSILAVVSYLGVGNPSPLISTNGAVDAALFQELSFSSGSIRLHGC